MAGIMIGDLVAASGRRQAAGFLVSIGNEAGEFADLAAEGFYTAAPFFIVSKELGIGLMQCFCTGRAGTNNDVCTILFEGFDVLFGNLFACFPVSHAESRFAAAALGLRVGYGNIEILQDLDNGFAGFREDEVEVAATEECCTKYRLFRIFLEELLCAITERLCGDGRKTASFGHAGEEERQMPDEFAGFDRFLGNRTDAQQCMEYLAVGENVLERCFFRQCKAVLLDIA